MIIRPAVQTDFPELRKIRPFLSIEELQRRLKLQVDGSALLLVAIEGDLLIGCILLKFHGKPTHPEYPDIEDLFVSEEFRGHGVGSALIAECERRARELGCSRIGMAVNPDLNPKAQVFYEKLGYHPDGRGPYLDGIYDGAEDWAVDMEKGIL